jgi:hypothetical protein
VMMNCNTSRHCEEQSDEAIQSSLVVSGLLRRKRSSQ